MSLEEVRILVGLATKELRNMRDPKRWFPEKLDDKTVETLKVCVGHLMSVNKLLEPYAPDVSEIVEQQ